MNYQDLCAAFAEDRNNWTEYRHEVYQVFGTMFGVLQKKLQLPNGEEGTLARVLPADESRVKQGMRYSVPGAVGFTEDGWANMGFQLTLREGPGVFPQRTYCFILWLRKRKENWLFKAFANDAEFDLGKRPDESSFDKPCEHLLQYLRDGLKDGLEQFLNEVGQEKKEPIGFKTFETEK